MTLLKDLTEDTTPELTDVLYGVKDPDGTPLDRRMSIENVLKLGSSVNLVDRGDPSAVDFDVGDFTADNTWRDLDLSSIVPAGATMVRLYCSFNPGTNSARTVHFRKNGNTNAVNVTGYYTVNEWIFEYREMDVFCDSNRVIEYRVSGSMNTMDVTVVGWLTDTSSMVALGYSDKLVDRGDITDYDFDDGDLTTDGSWYDLDLSSIVPAGATWVQLRVYVQDGVIGSYLGFRKNGSGSTTIPAIVRAQNTTGASDAQLLVPCDANRVIEYKTSAVTFDSIGIVVTGWVEGSSDYPAMNLVDRGDTADFDWAVGDFTIDGSWYDLDCSSIVPAGATWIQFRIDVKANAEQYFKLKKKGNPNDVVVTVLSTQVNAIGIGTQWLVPCDSNRFVEYSANAAFTNLNVVITGWVIDNSTYAPLKDLVARFDVSAADFDEGDLTTDGTWNDLDLSGIVPAGATFVLLAIQISDDVINSYLAFRKNGSSGSHDTAAVRTQVANQIVDAQVLVPLDSNRVIEYTGKNLVFSSIEITIIGWVMGSTSEALPYAPNDIINPEFAIAQEGATITAASTPANNDDTYVLDQWILLSDGNDVADITRESTAPPTGSKYNIKVEIETASKKVGIFQPIENQNSLKYTGDHASLSFWLKGDVDNIRAAIVSWDSTADTITSDIVSAWAAEGTNPTLATNWTYENTPANIAPTGSWVKHEIEGILIDTSGMTNLGVFFWLDDTDAAVDEYFEIGKVKLEQNLVCTKFLADPISKVVEDCQRLFCKSYDKDTAPGAVAETGSVRTEVDNMNSSDHTMYLSHKFPTQMRAAPTVTLYDAGGNVDKVTMAAGNNIAGTVTQETTGGFLAYGTNGASSGSRKLLYHWTASARL